MEVGLAQSLQDQCFFLAVVALVAFVCDACLINLKLNLHFQIMASHFNRFISF